MWKDGRGGASEEESIFPHFSPYKSTKHYTIFGFTFLTPKKQHTHTHTPRPLPLKIIKKAYRRLSKKYHVDSARYSSVLPGSCDTLEDVQQRWDDIKTSYEILSERTQRMRWDRRDLVRKPGEAVGRLLLDGVGAGVGLAARGVFSLSGLVIDKLSEEIPESSFEAGATSEEREKKQQRKGIFEKPEPDKKLVERLKRRTRNR